MDDCTLFEVHITLVNLLYNLVRCVALPNSLKEN